MLAEPSLWVVPSPPPVQVLEAGQRHLGTWLCGTDPQRGHSKGALTVMYMPWYHGPGPTATDLVFLWAVPSQLPSPQQDLRSGAAVLRGGICLGHLPRRGLADGSWRVLPLMDQCGLLTWSVRRGPRGGSRMGAWPC